MNQERQNKVFNQCRKEGLDIDTILSANNKIYEKELKQFMEANGLTRKEALDFKQFKEIQIEEEVYGSSYLLGAFRPSRKDKEKKIPEVEITVIESIVGLIIGIAFILFMIFSVYKCVTFYD